MASRRFADAAGNRWDVRVRSRSEWEFEPSDGNQEPPRLVQPPGYEVDPFELSVEELNTLLAQARPRKPPSRPSPFLD